MEKKTILELQSVNISGSLLWNTHCGFHASILWFSCGVAAPSEEAANRFILQGFTGDQSACFAWPARRSVTFSRVVGGLQYFCEVFTRWLMTCIFRGRGSTFETSIVMLRGRHSAFDFRRVWCDMFFVCQGHVNSWRQSVGHRETAWDCQLAQDRGGADPLPGMSCSVAGAVFGTPDTSHTTVVSTSTLHSTLQAFTLFTCKCRHTKLFTSHFTLSLHTCYTLYTPLSKLYALHLTLHPLHFTLYTPHFTLCTSDFILDAPHTTVHTLHTTLYTLHAALSTPHYTPCAWNFALYMFTIALHLPLPPLHVYSTLYTLNCTLHTLLSTLRTLPFALVILTLHFTLCTSNFTLDIQSSTLIHLTLYTPHATFYTPHSALYTWNVALYTVHFTFFKFHFALYTSHFMLCASHLTLNTLRCKFVTLHATLRYNLRARIYTPHSGLQAWGATSIRFSFLCASKFGP